MSTSTMITYRILYLYFKVFKSISLYYLCIKEGIKICKHVFNIISKGLYKYLRSSKISQNIYKYLRICTKILHYLQISQNIYKYLRMCTKIFEHVQISQNMYKYLRICANILKYVQKSSNKSKYLNILKNVYHCTSRFKLSFFKFFNMISFVNPQH